MKLFRAPHLGELAAALVDGELGHDARDRALAHLAHCTGCRAEVEALRRDKALLRRLPDPAPPDGLTERLVSRRPVVPDRTGRVFGFRRRPERATFPPSLWARSPGRRSRRHTRPMRVPSAHRHRAPLVLVGAACVILGVLGGAVALGGGTESGGRPVLPPTERFVYEHAATTVELPGSDPAVDAVTVAAVSGGR